MSLRRQSTRRENPCAARRRLTLITALTFAAIPPGIGKAQSAPPVTAAGPKFSNRVTIRASKTGATVWMAVRGADERFVPFLYCVTPCELELPPGEYRFTASVEGALRMSKVVWVRQGTRSITLSPTSEAGLAAGTLMMIGGPLTALIALASYGIEHGGCDAPECDRGSGPPPLFWFGCALSAGGFVTYSMSESSVRVAK